jgi:S1-C subfamily serine protease
VPLDPQSINCAARIIGNGSVIGTGFFLSVASEDTGAPLNYLVTAHHVINGQTALEVRVATPNGLLADPIPVPNWYQPIEDLDLAVAPLSPRSYMRIGLEDQVIADRWLRGPDEPQELFPGSPGLPEWQKGSGL